MMLRTSVVALYGACLVLGFCPEDSFAATATNLVTICTSATTTIQASKCTAWQYNVYSPTAYIESYPTVTPAETGINDPNYEYRLGSALTPTMGVKVCPTALTPGVSFNSPQADPCPNNKLVAASTVLPADTYAVTMNADGIVVYQVSTAGVSVVPGGPFVPNPPLYNSEYGVTTLSPTFTAVDPTGQYLYALYNVPGASEILSYQMVNGVPKQLPESGSLGFHGDCQNCNPGPTQLIVTAQHVYSNASNPPPYIIVGTTVNGVFTSSFEIGFYGENAISAESIPVSFAIDPQEQFLYWYFSSTGGTTADSVAIFRLNFATEAATLIQIMTQQGALTLGAK
jgi:hypothetical protein